MTKRVRVVVPVLVLALMAVLLAACSGGGQTQGGSTQSGQQQQQSQKVEMKNALVQDWAQSAHATPITFAAEEDGCKNCHDGLTFSQTGGGFQPRFSAEASGSATASQSADAQAGASGGKRDWIVATDCRACHTGRGAEIADSGNVSQIPSIDQAQGGTGAVCMACHNGWHPAGEQQGELRAPHGSVQTDMLYGVNTLSATGGTGSSTTTGSAGSTSTTGGTGGNKSPHLKITNTCAGCHMPTASNNLPGHTFKPSFKGCQQQGCHKQDMTDGGTAKQDYDGDGQKEKVTAEVDGMLTTLKDAINKKAGSTDFKSEGGAVVFSGGTKQGGNDPAYRAAYNYFFVMQDKSKGIHNAQFTFKLLQDSISSVSQ